MDRHDTPPGLSEYLAVFNSRPNRQHELRQLVSRLQLAPALAASGWTAPEKSTDGSAVAILAGDGRIDLNAGLELQVGLERVNADDRPSNQLNLRWRDNRLTVKSDPFRMQPLLWAQLDDELLVASDLRMLLAAGVEPHINPQALYDYLNFNYIPGPDAIIQGVHHLPIGCELRWTIGSAPQAQNVWRPTFPEDLRGSEHEQANRLFSEIDGAVIRQRPVSGKYGAFNSGGTDSSAISGILSRHSNEPVSTFSIGFAEPGYDELEYARTAIDHFGLDGHTRRVSAEQTLEILPQLIGAFDEPFGNSSAVPTFFCAQMAAAQDIPVLLAGDGGDEIFGGNERYAKDRIFAAWQRLPAFLRRPVDGLGTALGRLSDHHFINRINNFTHRASLANPERFYTDDSFASDYFNELLTADLRSEVDQRHSLALVEVIYAQADSDSPLHRLMYVDQLMAIGRNDLTKVNRAAKWAGVAVAYPYLDTELVEFAGRIQPQWKIRGMKKRYLYKKALEHVLPEKILYKKKQGFGLPFALWMQKHEGFRELIRDTLLSQRSRERGYFDPGFVRSLIERHENGAWDFSGPLWGLLALELWHQQVIDR